MLKTLGFLRRQISETVAWQATAFAAAAVIVGLPLGLAAGRWTWDVFASYLGIVTWYAIRIGPSEFGIFDTFEADAGRQAHLSGKVAEALMAKASELFVGPPDIRPIDVLASK